MESSPPIVSAREAPLQNADLDVRMCRNADVVPQLQEVVADTPESGLEVLGLVLVIVDTEDIEVLPGDIDDLLAPGHVVGPLLSARHDLRRRSDLPQAAAIKVDDSGVTLRREAIIHGFVVDLEVADAVGLGMSVGRPQPSPFSRRRIVPVIGTDSA